MGVPHFSVLGGTVDGVNKVFYTPTPYTAGTVAIFINGQLKRPGYDDGWVETDPATGAVTLREAPQPCPPDHDEVIQAFYIDTVPDGAALDLTGIIEEIEDLTGTLAGTPQLTGIVDDAEDVVGSLTGDGALSGQIDGIQEIIGQLRECS